MPCFSLSRLILVAGLAVAHQPLIADQSVPVIQKIKGAAGSHRRAVRSVTILKQSGGRVSWSPDGKWILFDRKGVDGYYDLSWRPDGKGFIGYFHDVDPGNIFTGKMKDEGHAMVTLRW